MSKDSKRHKKAMEVWKQSLINEEHATLIEIDHLLKSIEVDKKMIKLHKIQLKICRKRQRDE